MAEITRRMLIHAEHARVLYSKHQAKLQKLIRAGARVESGCGLLFNQAALDSKIPAFTIDRSRFGPEWVAKMRTLLRHTDGGRKERLETFRILLQDIDRCVTAAVMAHMRDIADGDTWERMEVFFTLAVRLRFALWRLRFAGWMYAAHAPRAASVAAGALEVLERLLLTVRPAAIVIPIR
jgi:hypothetical protein